GPNACRERRVWGVHDDREAGREDHACPMNCRIHSTGAASADLKRKTLRERGVAVRTEEVQFSRSGGAGKPNCDGPVRATSRGERFPRCATAVVRYELHLREN